MDVVSQISQFWQGVLASVVAALIVGVVVFLFREARRLVASRLDLSAGAHAATQRMMGSVNLNVRFSMVVYTLVRAIRWAFFSIVLCIICVGGVILNNVTPDMPYVGEFARYFFPLGLALASIAAFRVIRIFEHVQTALLDGLDRYAEHVED